MSDYIADEDAYYTYMVAFSSDNRLASYSNSDADEILEYIVKELVSAQTKNKVMLAWRLMATFFTLDDDVMERYLQIIYGVDDSEDEEQAVHPAPPATTFAAAADAKVIVNKLS
jgi:hypothetical protein